MFKRGRNVMPGIPPLDFDILYLIVDQAYGRSHPLAYRIDSATLQSLCRVSKAFNDIATPILYSSVTLFTGRGLLSFAATARENPQLLKSCRSLLLSPHDTFGKTRIGLQALQDISSSTPALQRLIWMGDMWDEKFFSSFRANMSEVSFLRLDLLKKRSFGIEGLQSFVNVERLVLQCFVLGGFSPTNNHIFDVLLGMPRLTHVAVANAVQNCRYRSDHLEDVNRLLRHSALKRIVCGWTRDAWARASTGITARDRPFASGRVEVVYLMYDSGERSREWFADRVIDGTIWELKK
jgi:hypothetical protein